MIQTKFSPSIFRRVMYCNCIVNLSKNFLHPLFHQHRLISLKTSARLCVCVRAPTHPHPHKCASGGRVMFLLSMALARELIKDLKRLTLCQWTTRLCVVCLTDSCLERTFPLSLFFSRPNLRLVYAPPEWDHSECLWIPSIHIDKRV